MVGNIEYFVYLITKEMQMFSNTLFAHKASHIYAIVTFLVTFGFSSVRFILIFFTYEAKHSKYFFVNAKVLITGSTYLFMTFFVKNVFLGFVHSYFNYDYSLKILPLWSIEFFFLTANTYVLIGKYVDNMARQWVVILCGFLRLLIIVSFYLDYRMGSDF